MHARAAIAASLLILPTLGVSAVLAVEDEATLEEQQAQVEENRQRQQELAAQIGLLQASDVELQLELDTLTGRIAAQERAVVATEARMTDLRQRVQVLGSDVRRAEAKVLEHREIAVDRAIAAYIHPTPSRFEVVVGASEINEVAIKDVLLHEVASQEREVLDAFELAVADLSQKRAEADGAIADLEAAEADALEELDLLEAARARQEAVREVLSVRIAEFRGEADDLAAEEAALQSIIADRLRPPPTTVPPTTAAPTTTAPPVGPTTTTAPGTDPTTSTSSTTTTSTTSGPGDPRYDLVWPTKGVLTSHFGIRWGRMHNGIDIGAPTGTPIVASASGEAFFSGVLGGFGNVVFIDHFNGLITVYAHQDSLAVREGERVSRGQVIGTVGSTGNSTGPHLHFETRVDGVPRDPLTFLP